MPYLVKIPKDPRFEKAFSFHLKKIGETDEFILYQGIVEAIIPLNVDWPEAVDLYQRIKVEGGYKRLPLSWYENGQNVPARQPVLFVAPKRNNIIRIRLSEEEYELLKRDAREVGESVSSWARKLVMNIVWEYLEREKFKEAMRKVKEKEGC